jgi:hypothetical protein
MNFLQKMSHSANSRLHSLLFLPFLLSLLFISCGDDDPTEDPEPQPVGYLVSDIKYNTQAIQQFVCTDFYFNSKVDTAGNDTIMFGGDRVVDASYMRFFLINDDLGNFSAGDSLEIPFDTASGSEVYASIRINSVSTEVFHPAPGLSPGKVYIDEINVANKRIKGRFYGTFYVGTDSLKVTNGQFLLDE